MNNLQGIFGLLIVLAITLTMGLQFTNFRDGFVSGDLNKKNTNDKTDDLNKKNTGDMPIHTKKSGSIAKQSVYDDTTPNY
jgi:hypothetical protein